MTDTDPVEAPGPIEHVVLLRCERERCEYVVLDAQDGNDNTAKAQELMEGHLYQHDHPQEWLAEQAALREAAEGAED